MSDYHHPEKELIEDIIMANDLPLLKGVSYKIYRIDTLLYLASQYGHLDIIKYLFSISSSDKDERLYLFIEDITNALGGAVANRNWKAAHYLIEKLLEKQKEVK